MAQAARRASAAATQPRSASSLKCPGLNGSTSSAAVAPPRAARHCEQRSLPRRAPRGRVVQLSASRRVNVHRRCAFARRPGRSQADRQRRRHDLADGMVVVVRRPAQQLEGHRVEDGLGVQYFQRATCSLAASIGESCEVPPGCRPAGGGRTALSPECPAQAVRARHVRCSRPAADNRRLAAAACRGRFAGSRGRFCPQMAVDKSVEKPGS